MQTFETHSVAETEQVAADFARTLVGGTCVTLEGDLGAGKTQFVRGLVKGLGGDGRAVSSPTYILLNVYKTPTLTVYHLDAYRVGGADDFDAIGFDELLMQDAVVVVEWPSKVQGAIPPTRRRVTIDVMSETTRRITI